MKAELNSSKAYIPLPRFLTSTQSVYDPGWLPYRLASFVVGKPLWWALQQLSIVGDDTSGHSSDSEQWRKVKGDYVVLSLLERAADAVMRKHHPKGGVSLADSLYNSESFYREFADKAISGVILSREDTKVLLKYLERNKKAVIVQKDVRLRVSIPLYLSQ